MQDLMNWQEGLRYRRDISNIKKWEEKIQEMQISEIRNIYMVSSVQ